jgi:hypothetical protein
MFCLVEFFSFPLSWLSFPSVEFAAAGPTAGDGKLAALAAAW